MRKALVAAIVAVLVAVPTSMMNAPVVASPGEKYSGPYFGDGNVAPDCLGETLTTSGNDCHRMRTGLNALDSPQVDVLVLVPVSPTAERDMRIMRQSIEMWEGGIDYLADQMGLGWLGEGLDFHITVDAFDPAGDKGGEFTTYPIVDPEIVVIASNPVGGIGIGIDPVDFVFTNENLVPCHTVENPFDFEYWDALPGFDRHHDERSGTYNEDCGGAGGNICFAINGAIDPAPEKIDVFNLFDLVSHEVGHCLTIGHVGDGAEGKWGALPPNDIMAYSSEPKGLNKCVSTLDVEGIALRMSRYLDVDGDGAVTGADALHANDKRGDGRNAFQVQHPDDHLYASSTGSPRDCPQPDLGLLPGPRTDWTPQSRDEIDEALTVTTPTDGAVSNDGRFDVTGTVARSGTAAPDPQPAATVADSSSDASTPFTEIESFDVVVTGDDSNTSGTVTAVMTLKALWPTTHAASGVSYSVTIDGRRFDSFVYRDLNGAPRTWDSGAAKYVDGVSTWDYPTRTVKFTIARSYLHGASISAPYDISSQANLGSFLPIADDYAPDSGGTVAVSNARVVAVPDAAPLASAPRTETFTRTGGNRFSSTDSTLGTTTLVDQKKSHRYSLGVDQWSDVTFNMVWSDAKSDLDLHVTGAANSGRAAATANMPEVAALTKVKGTLEIRVEPYLVADPVSGVTYSLTAEITPRPATDTDGDGVIDDDDACATVAGTSQNGCPVAEREQVEIYVGDVLVGSEIVDTAGRPDRVATADSFAIPVELPEGTHELRVVWERLGKVLASRTLSVTRVADEDGDGVPNDADKCPGSDDRLDEDGDGVPDGCDSTTGTDGPDADGDGITDADDNCPTHPNSSQKDLDGDGKGDACDPDIDGDGYSNGRERAHGSDPYDPGSVPEKKRPSKG